MNNDWVLFTGVVIALVVLAIGISAKFNWAKIKSNFSGKRGKNIIVGIILALTFGLSVVWTDAAFGDEVETDNFKFSDYKIKDLTFFGVKGEWFPQASIYIGLDRTFGQSPQCESEGSIGISDQQTSNIGLRGTFFRTESRRFSINGKYTHHSCAFNSDRNGYDAVGLEAEWVFWGA